VNQRRDFITFFCFNVAKNQQNKLDCLEGLP
jgi:hypothetical protein